MSKRTGVTRGDKRRNRRLEELRRLVPRDNALVGVDLAEDKQALAVCDHDSRVLARKTVRPRRGRISSGGSWTGRWNRPGGAGLRG